LIARNSGAEKSAPVFYCPANETESQSQLQIRLVERGKGDSLESGDRQEERIVERGIKFYRLTCSVYYYH